MGATEALSEGWSYDLERIKAVQPMYYIEFFSRKPGVSLEKFQETVTRVDAWWAEANPQDRPVLHIGRTWRLAPTNAQYIRVWEISSAARIDEWTQQRLADVKAASMLDEWLSVADLDAGIYEDIGLEQI